MEIAVDHNHNLRLTRAKSRKNIEHFTRFVRNYFNIKGLYVDIMAVLELVIPTTDKDFYYSVYKITDSLNDKPAYYDCEKNCIFIREDIYENALEGDGFARFTIAHEIGHYYLFGQFGIPEFVNLEEIEKYTDKTLKSKDPEWQADVFAGEFLCCSELIKGLSVKEIQEKCVVSKKAAQTAWDIVNEITYEIDFFSNGYFATNF